MTSSSLTLQYSDKYCYMHTLNTHMHTQHVTYIYTHMYAHTHVHTYVDTYVERERERHTHTRTHARTQIHTYNYYCCCYWKHLGHRLGLAMEIMLLHDTQTHGVKRTKENQIISTYITTSTQILYCITWPAPYSSWALTGSNFPTSRSLSKQKKQQLSTTLKTSYKYSL